MYVCKTYLSDILVSHSADLLDIGRTLRHVLEVVANQDELILLVLGDLDVDALLHDDAADNLLADEVADLDLVEAGLGVLVDVDVGEMRVDVAHLVLEALRDTGNQVLDDRANRAEGGDVLAVAVVDLDGDLVLLGLGEGDGKVTEVLDELPCRNELC